MYKPTASPTPIVSSAPLSSCVLVQEYVPCLGKGEPIVASEQTCSDLGR